MRTFAQKQKPATRSPASLAQKHAARAIPRLQSVGRNHAVQRLLGHELSHGVSQPTVQQTTGSPALQRKEMAAEAKLDRVLRAAARARSDPNDRVRMLISGSEIVYRLIDIYLPAFSDLLSGVSYDPSVASIVADTTAGDTVSIRVGKKFILETNSTTLVLRTTEIGTELSRWKSRFKIGPDESSSFRKRIWALMDVLMTSSQPGLRTLYERMLHSPVPITIRSISDDASTWHVKEIAMNPGDRPEARGRRSHTDPSDSKPRGAARDASTASTIFINPFRIKPSDAKSGTFVHELVHALDLASGLYNSAVEIRERRAVFFQNMWREEQGKPFREDYHGDFITDDYQRAVRADREGRPNGVAAVTAYLLSHNDLPPATPESS